MEQTIKHHGIKGQRWGVRRFQNEDGSRTKAGESRYRIKSGVNSSDNTIKKKGSKLDEPTTRRKLISNAKKYIAGAAIASATFAAIAVPVSLAIGKRFITNIVEDM